MATYTQPILVCLWTGHIVWKSGSNFVYHQIIKFAKPKFGNQKHFTQICSYRSKAVENQGNSLYHPSDRQDWHPHLAGATTQPQAHGPHLLPNAKQSFHHNLRHSQRHPRPAVASLHLHLPCWHMRATSLFGPGLVLLPSYSLGTFD